MSRLMRYLLTLVSLLQLVFAVGLIAQIPAFTRLWPLPYTNSLSFIFIGSITAAAAASTLWCVITREDAAMAGVALDYIAIFVPVGILMLQLGGRSANRNLTTFGAVSLAMAALGLVILVWSLRRPARDRRPVPRLVRVSFVGFIAALIIAGGQMVLKNTHVMPWQISTDATIIYGWMFLGAAAYFTYAILRPGWYNAGGQLAGFLAYDLVLIIPFLQRLPTAAPDIRLNLMIYIGAVSYSGLLAIYYLFLRRETRLWRVGA
jgi:hypothetical protein